jgi:hypothetical protein
MYGVSDPTVVELGKVVCAPLREDARAKRL